jgi:hypothetical protein
MKHCIGCGAGGEHQIVAIMKGTDVPADAEASTPSARGFVAVPVCADCHNDPSHRVRAIKGHFFPAATAGKALQRAGSNSVG